MDDLNPIPADLGFSATDAALLLIGFAAGFCVALLAGWAFV